MSEACVVIGAGGHARVVLDCLALQSGVHVVGLLDPSVPCGTCLDDVPVLGGDDELERLHGSGVRCFVVAVGGAGDNRPRQRLFDLAAGLGMRPLGVQHPAALRSARATVGEGCQLMPGAILNAGAVLGRNVIVNSGAIVEHDCRVGDHAHVASGAVLASGVEVGALAHVGAGATVRQGITIGEGAIVGAGAVVVRNVAAWQTVVGVPARLLEGRS